VELLVVIILLVGLPLAELRWARASRSVPRTKVWRSAGLAPG
jgi:hypothetical protein